MHMSIEASLFAWNAQTVFLFFLHLVDINQIPLVVVFLDRKMHRHVAWCLLSLQELPVPPAAPALG